MGLIQRIKSYYHNKRLDRLESDWMEIRDRVIAYVPKLAVVGAIIDPQKEFTLRVHENLIWYMGKPYNIRIFYKTNRDILTAEMNFFWSNAPANYRKVHSGVPKLIANKSATIIFGGGIDNEVAIYKTSEDGKVSNELDKDKSRLLKDTLEVLKDSTQFMAKLKEAAVTESWSGHVFIKYSYDVKLSEFPIIEICDIRNAEVIKHRGITTAIVFKTYINKIGSNFVLKETYTTNEKGEPLIINKLYRTSTSGEVEEPLGLLKETAEIQPEFAFEGMHGMLAFEKPNKLPNSEFLDCYYGASDFAGSYSAFDALDEVLSEIFAEIRDNKTIRYVPETMLEYDGEGNVKELNTFVTNYVKTKADQDQNSKNEINITQIADKQASLGEKWKVAITTAINNAGYSPLALGITGLEAVNAGEQSQRERNKVTLETRSDKIGLWKPTTEYMLLQLLALNSWMQKKALVVQEGINRIDVDFSNCNINVKFGDYIIESQQKQIETWGTAKGNKVASTREAVKNIHPDWDDAKIDEEVNLIRFEEGMSLDNPNNLPNLTGKENEDGTDNPDNEDMKDKIEKGKVDGDTK